MAAFGSDSSAWSEHELQPIEIGRDPIVTMDSELESLLRSVGVNHNRTPPADVLEDSHPQVFSHPGGQMPNEDSRSDLH